MKLYLTLALFLVSANLFCQYSEINSNFSMTFPSKPETSKYPGDATGTVYQYKSGNEYTIQLVRISIPAEYRSEISNSDIEQIALGFLGGYLRTAGGGQLMSKELLKIQSYKAIQFEYSLNSSLSLYKYAKMFFCYTPYNIYTIIYYYSGSKTTYNNYMKSFKIFN